MTPRSNLRRNLCSLTHLGTLLAFASCAGAARHDSNVVAGLALTPVRVAEPDTIVFRRTVTRDGVDSSTGTRTVVRRVTREGAGLRFLEVEQRFPAAGGEIIDTAIAELATLRAVAHRSHQPQRTMLFTFDSAQAQGTVTSRSAGEARVENVRQDTGGLIFDSNIIDLVVAALPLRPGFSATLPFFIYERGGRVPMPVTVQEQGSAGFQDLGQREVWVVSVGVPGAPATVWVDRRTREVLRVRYDIAARNMSFTDDRITPLGQ